MEIKQIEKGALAFAINDYGKALFSLYWPLGVRIYMK